MSDLVVNLTFHGLGRAPRPLDDGEAGVWVDDVAEYEAVLDLVRDRPNVRMTFDDGNASDIEHGLPALQQRGLRATFFVVADRIGTPGFLSAADVLALRDAGMTIGCHGMRHRPWRASLGDAALHEELVEARRTLEAVTGSPVTEAACPFGAYDRRVLRRLRGTGYTHVYTSDRGASRQDAWLQARTTLQPGTAVAEAGRVTAGGGRAPHSTAARQAKLLAKRLR